MKEAFLKEIFSHQQIIYKVCRIYRDTKEDREDLFQEIVYQLWKSYPSFKGKSKFSSWMYRIALNTAMASFRKLKVNITYPEQVPENQSSEQSSQDTQMEKLLGAIKKLDPADRAIVSLYLDDLNYTEIAEVVGITANNVGVRLNRIKHKIKELLNH